MSACQCHDAPSLACSAAMSSEVLAQVLEFTNKAGTLVNKGHVMRAAEIYGRAAEVARALGADNLVVVDMQLRQANMVNLSMDGVRNAAGPGFYAAHCAKVVAMLSAAMEALERRRVTDTLLEGKCTREEELHYGAQMQRHDPLITSAEVASKVALVGVSTLFRAAANATNVLSQARAFAPDCSCAHFQHFTRYVVMAVELMQQRWRQKKAFIDVEAAFTEAFCKAALAAPANGLEARLVGQLEDALQRLSHSGMLQEREFAQLLDAESRAGAALKATVRNSASVPGLRSCALPGCGAKEAHPQHFKRCAACHTVVYCRKDHQLADWPRHKAACKAARKANEQEE